MSSRRAANQMNLTKTKQADSQNYVLVLILSLSLAVAGPVLSAAPGVPASTDTLTLDRCVALARQNSPELQIAQNATNAAKLDRQIAAKSNLPQLKFVGDAGYAPISPSFGYDPAISNGGEMGARIVAEQTLYSGGQRSLQMKQADAEINSRSLAWRQQDRDLVYTVREAFIELLRAQQVLQLQKQRAARLTDYSELVDRLSEAGTVGHTDALRTQVELSRAKIDAQAAQSTLWSARLNLARLLGAPQDTTLAVSGSLDNLLFDTADSTATGTAVSLPGNLDLSAARVDSLQSTIAISLAKAQWRPKVSLSADAGVMTSRENLLLQPQDRYNSTGYSVGVNVEIPLWDWGVHRNEVSKSRTELMSATENINLIRRDIEAQGHDLLLRFQSARDRLASLHLVEQSAKQIYMLSLAQYADGLLSASDVLISQQSLTDVRESSVEALAEIQSLQAQLDRIAQTAEERKP